MANSDYIDTPRLKTLVEAGAINYVSVRGVRGGFVVVVKVGLAERTLRAQKRADARIFATMDGIVGYCTVAGIRRIDVDLAGYLKEAVF